MRRLLVVPLVVALVVAAVGCKGKEAPKTNEAPKPTAGSPGGDAVAARVKKALADAFPGVTVTLNADDVLVVAGTGSGSASVEIALDNIRRSCASSEGECASAIESIVENTKKTSVAMAKADSPEADAPPDKTKVRLTPKPTEWLEAADAQTAKIPDKVEENRLVRQKFVADLWWTYVIDEPSGMRLINGKALQQLGMTVEQLHTLAVTNLAAQYPKLDLTELAPGMWTIEPGDYLDSARLALTDQWKAEAKKRGGTLILAVPARSRVFVSNEPKLRAGFDKVRAMAFAEEDHPLTEAVLVWTDKGWQPER